MKTDSGQQLSCSSQVGKSNEERIESWYNIGNTRFSSVVKAVFISGDGETTGCLKKNK